MPIVINLDVQMAKRKIKLNELSHIVDISVQNLSVLKTGKARAIRFSTLEKLCQALMCTPGDLIEYRTPPSEAATQSSPAVHAGP